MSAGDLEGKVAVVTSGSMGLVQAVVTRIADGGAKVVFCTNDDGSLETSLSQAPPGVSGIEADISKEADMERLIGDAVDRHGGLDILVNAAGIQRYGTVLTHSPSVCAWTSQISLTGRYGSTTGRIGPTTGPTTRTTLRTSSGRTDIYPNTS